MGFQSAVRFDQGYGVPGEFAFDGPKRAEPGLLNSAAAANNVIGRAFTLDAATPGVWRAGDPTANGERIAILTGPKQYAAYGDATGPLAASLTLPNGVVGQFATMGQIIVRSTTPNNAVGNIVRFVQASGEIVTAAPGTALPAGQSEIPNATVIRVPQPADDGLVVIQLTTQ